MIIKRAIDVTEKCFLVTIALFTVGAMAQEVILLIEQRSVALKGNRPLEPQAREVEFFPMEEVLHEEVKIHRQPDHGRAQAR